jgi:hypothetical protein
MRNYDEGQVNRSPETAPSTLFAMMKQYADEDTDVAEKVVANDLDREHADDDGSDTRTQVTWNIPAERELESSPDVDAEDY